MFNSLDDVKQFIETTIKKHAHKFVTDNYSIRYSSRQRRTLASVKTTRRFYKPVFIEFVFNNKYLNTYKVNEDNIKDTVLHEIAHAIVGGEHHHDRVWKNCCYQLGCEAKRCKKINVG